MTSVRQIKAVASIPGIILDEDVAFVVVDVAAVAEPAVPVLEDPAPADPLAVADDAPPPPPPPALFDPEPA